MCRPVRWTESRGRTPSALRRTLRRTRVLRRSNSDFVFSDISALLLLLAFLAAERLGVRLRPELAALDRGRHLVRDDELELAELPLDLDGLAGDIDGDAARDGDRVLAYARHGASLRTRDRGLRRRHWRRGPRCPT